MSDFEKGTCCHHKETAMHLGIIFLCTSNKIETSFKNINKINFQKILYTTPNLIWTYKNKAHSIKLNYYFWIKKDLTTVISFFT